MSEANAEEGTLRWAGRHQERPSIRSANLLFLISMVVMIVSPSIPAPGASPHLVSIIPMVLFLLLASLFIRYHRLSFRATLRLRWPGLRTAALSLVIGTGVWMVATWLGHLVDLLFGYSVPWSPDFFPTTPAQVEDTYLVVRNAEPVWTPAGNLVAWRVTLGDQQTAWYDAEPPHTLVRYHDGTVTYLLTDAERENSTNE